MKRPKSRHGPPRLGIQLKSHPTLFIIDEQRWISTCQIQNSLAVLSFSHRPEKTPPNQSQTKGYHSVHAPSCWFPCSKQAFQSLRASICVAEFRLHYLLGQSLKQSKLHFLFVLPKPSAISCSVMSTLSALFSFLTSGKSSRYRRTLPASLSLPSKKLKRLFRRHHRGASRRHIPRKP